MRKSRKPAFAVLALAGALAMVVAGVAIGATGSASENGVEQTITAEPSKTKTIKKAKPGIPATGMNLEIGVGIKANDGTTLAPASRRVDIGVGTNKEFFFDPTGLKVVKASQLEQTSTSEAENVGKGALVGKGTSSAACSSPGGPIGPSNQFPGVVRAFNGGKKGKTLTLLLHAFTNFPTGPVTTVLVGKVNKANNFGVDVEVLGEGSCGISDFTVDLGATTKVKGEKHNYIAGACPDGSWDFPSTFQYYDNPYNVSQLSPEAKVPCKGKG